MALLALPFNGTASVGAQTLAKKGNVKFANNTTSSDEKVRLNFYRKLLDGQESEGRAQNEKGAEFFYKRNTENNSVIINLEFRDTGLYEVTLSRKDGIIVAESESAYKTEAQEKITERFEEKTGNLREKTHLKEIYEYDTRKNSFIKTDFFTKSGIEYKNGIKIKETINSKEKQNSDIVEKNWLSNFTDQGELLNSNNLTKTTADAESRIIVKTEKKDNQGNEYTEDDIKVFDKETGIQAEHTLETEERDKSGLKLETKRFISKTEDNYETKARSGNLFQIYKSQRNTANQEYTISNYCEDAEGNIQDGGIVTTYKPDGTVEIEIYKDGVLEPMNEIEDNELPSEEDPAGVTPAPL